MLIQNQISVYTGYSLREAIYRPECYILNMREIKKSKEWKEK